MKNILTTFTLAIVVLLSACKKDEPVNPEDIDPTVPEQFAKLDQNQQTQQVVKWLNALANKSLKLYQIIEVDAAGVPVNAIVPSECESEIIIHMPAQFRALAVPEDKFLRENIEGCLDTYSAGYKELNFGVTYPPYEDYKIGFLFFTNIKDMPPYEEMFYKLDNDPTDFVEFFSTRKEERDAGAKKATVYRRYIFEIL